MTNSMSKFLNIKYILFDVGNVLVYKVTHEDENVAKLLDLSREEYREILDKIIDRQTPKEKKQFKEMNTLEKEISYLNMLHKKICTYLGIKPTKKLIEKMTKCRTQGDFAVKDGVLESLESLSDKFKLGILSNAPPSRRHHELKIQGLYKYFDHIFISKEIGLYKPNPEIYQYALERIGYSEDEVLFVDDKIDYLQGAENAGLSNLILYLKNDKSEEEVNYPTIQNLKELVEILK
jgi:HAD superfamily hydrolase (TIGR01549 family)